MTEQQLAGLAPAFGDYLWEFRGYLGAQRIQEQVRLYCRGS
jgi:hypothetical protein